MQISQVARSAGLSAKKIRHYESIGLIPSAARRASNYRDYDQDDVHRLAFVSRARDLGFSIDEIRQLLRLWADQTRSSADVKAMAQAHITDLNARIAQLEVMRDTLNHLAGACEGDDRPDCPIIEELAGKPTQG